jgi:hypothetical protein
MGGVHLTIIIGSPTCFLDAQGRFLILYLYIVYWEREFGYVFIAIPSVYPGLQAGSPGPYSHSKVIDVLDQVFHCF